MPRAPYVRSGVLDCSDLLQAMGSNAAWKRYNKLGSPVWAETNYANSYLTEITWWLCGKLGMIFFPYGQSRVHALMLSAGFLDRVPVDVMWPAN
jgi:hypothetical protein